MDDLFANLQRFVRAREETVPTELEDPTSTADWKAELAREHGITLHAGSGAAGDAGLDHGSDAGSDPLSAWQRELLQEKMGPLPAGLAARLAREDVKPMVPPALLQSRRLPTFQGFDPARVPAHATAYVALLDKVYTKRKVELVRRVLAEPAIRAGYEVWEPGNQTSNFHVVYEAFDRLSRIMGEVYGFRPAAMSYSVDMNGASGTYHNNTRTITLALNLMKNPANELFETIVHEQTHKLQFELMWRLENPSNRPPSLDELYLTYYWIRDELSGKRTKARELARRGQLGPYRNLAIEYHAYDTAEAVQRGLVRAYGRR